MDGETKGQVLIVDNDEEVLARLEKELAGVGYETATTWSGFEALRLLECGAFECLLVDGYLPDLYIGDFLEKVTKLPLRPRHVVLMETQPPQNRRAFGSRTFVVADKEKLPGILRALAAEDSRDQKVNHGWH